MKKPAAAVKKDKPAKLSYSGGIDASLNTVMEPFSLDRYIKSVMTEMNLVSTSAASRLKIVTACSGPLAIIRVCCRVACKPWRDLTCRSGLPSLVLKAMNLDFVELAGCDLNESAAQACLTNTAPAHFFKTIESMLDDTAFCHVHQQNCATISKSQDADLLIAGYPCNRSSQLNPCRFDQGEGDGAVGNEHSDVLLDLAALIRKIRPKMFILENVTGILKRRAGASESADQNVLQWVHEQLDIHLKGAWKFMDFVVDSKPLHLVGRHTSAFFEGACMLPDTGQGLQCASACSPSAPSMTWTCLGCMAS